MNLKLIKLNAIEKIFKQKRVFSFFTEFELKVFRQCCLISEVKH